MFITTKVKTLAAKKSVRQWLWFIGLYVAAVAIYAAIEFSGRDFVQWLIKH